VAPRAWSGAALAFFGVYLIMAGKPPQEGPAPSLRGDLLVLLAAVCWCVYTVMSKPLLERISPLKLTTVSMIWGLVFMLPFCAGPVLAQDWAAVPILSWTAMAYSFLFALVIAYILWYRSVAAVGNVRTAVYSNLVPVTGTLSGWLLLEERIYPALALGAACIFAGIALTRGKRGEASLSALPDERESVVAARAGEPRVSEEG
jgi:drug/metabolite transporter (DMT)-like permease